MLQKEPNLVRSKQPKRVAIVTANPTISRMIGDGRVVVERTDSGKDNSLPGPHPTCYTAFMADQDTHNFESVTCALT